MGRIDSGLLRGIEEGNRNINEMFSLLDTPDDSIKIMTDDPTEDGPPAA
jgi:hypothetical protein